MATITIFGETSNEGVESTDTANDYAAARAGENLILSGAGGPPVPTNLTIGQTFVIGTTYGVWQAFFAFDTSVLAGIGTLNSTIFALYGKTDSSLTDFTMEARANSWGPTVTTADWVAGSSLSAHTLYATFATSGFTTAGYNNFTESGTALTSALNTAGITYLMVCSDHQTNNTAPTQNERIGVWLADAAGTTNDPKLIVTYTPSAVPKTHGATVGALLPPASGTLYGTGEC